MKVNSDIGLPPPGSSVLILVYLTYPSKLS